MSTKLDCLLVRLPEDEIGFYRFSESLGLGYVAAFLREAGHRVEIVDGALDRLTQKQIVARIVERAPDLLGFSVMFDGYRVAQAVIRAARRRGFAGHVTMGQHFATFNARQILADTPEIDSIVRFEGEETALELLRAVQAGRPIGGIAGLAYRDETGAVIETPPRPLVADLDRLPFPARDVLARNPETVTTINISASRGCPWRCKFCTISTFYRIPEGKLWRHRSPANVVDEMQGITERFGPRPFFFVDDQFMGAGRPGRQFVHEFAHELIARDFPVRFSIETRADTVDRETFALLKRAGLQLVFLGIESGYQHTLDLYRKDITVQQNMAAIKLLQDLDIDIQMGFIMFHEGTTLHEIRANLAFLEEANAFDVVPFFNQLKIHAGTAFMAEDPTDELTPEYQKPWEIADARARDYRDRLHVVALPLTVPAYALRIERRFLDQLPRADLARFEQRLRRALLHVAEALLEAVEQGRASEGTVEDLRRWSAVEADRLQADIAVVRLLGGMAAVGAPADPTAVA